MWFRNRARIRPRYAIPNMDFNALREKESQADPLLPAATRVLVSVVEKSKLPSPRMTISDAIKNNELDITCLNIDVIIRTKQYNAILWLSCRSVFYLTTTT